MTADFPADLLEGGTDHTVAAARAEQAIAENHGGWAPPARLLRAAALDGRHLDQVGAWAADLTPAVIHQQVDAILTGYAPSGIGNDTVTTGGQQS